jgi:hypothetical protein
MFFYDSHTREFGVVISHILHSDKQNFSAVTLEARPWVVSCVTDAKFRDLKTWWQVQ